MVKYETLYQNLLIQLRNRISRNSKLVTKLVEILSLNREAIYRRLRQEVPFTLEEVVTIVKEFNISLDSLIQTEVKIPSLLQSFESEDIAQIDYSVFEKYLQVIKDVAANSKGEISFVMNLLPMTLYNAANFIYRFYYFKWQYYSIQGNQTKFYHDILLPDRLSQIIEDIFVHLKNVKTGYYVLGDRIFQNFVNDVIYFNSIRLIRDEDIHHIKDELLHFINYLEIIAAKGFVDNPSNKVYIYISDTGIDMSYSYADLKSSLRFALICPFNFNSLLTFNDKILDLMKYQIRSRIRTSGLLSVTGEKLRTAYFESQRKVVEQL